MSEQPTTPGVPAWELPDRLRRALRYAGIGSNEMAQYLEVSRHTISNWINGHTRPPATALKLWAMRCGVPYGWLTNGEEYDSDGHIRALIRDQQPGYSEIDNPITAMRRALGHGQRRPNNRAEKIR